MTGKHSQKDCLERTDGFMDRLIGLLLVTISTSRNANQNKITESLSKPKFLFYIFSKVWIICEIPYLLGNWDKYLLKTWYDSLLTQILMGVNKRVDIDQDREKVIQTKARFGAHFMDVLYACLINWVFLPTYKCSSLCLLRLLNNTLSSQTWC